MTKVERKGLTNSSQAIVVGFAFTLLLGGCSPRVEVAIPDKPINININAKIDHEVRIKVEKDVEEVFSEESGLF